MQELVSLDECAVYNDTSKLLLQKLRYKDKVINRTDRFVADKIVLNYKNPLEFELSDLYFKALFICGGSEYDLAREIAPMLKIKIGSAYSYLHRFNFKHWKKAYLLKDVLNKYCKSSIWYVDGDFVDGTNI